MRLVNTLPTGVYQRTEEQKRKIGLVHKGKIVSDETRKKIGLAQLDRIHSVETKEKMRLAKLGKKLSEETIAKMGVRLRGDKAHNWKGDHVKYNGLHMYIRKYMPKPELCGFCHQKKKLHAACITGIYNRDFTNWKYLCVSCHKKYDLSS